MLGLQEKRQWRAQKEEEALKNSVLDTATAARFSTAAALQARGRTGDSAAIDWRTNSLAASPPRNAPEDDAAEAAVAAAPAQAQAGPSTIKSQPSTGVATSLIMWQLSHVEYPAFHLSRTVKLYSSPEDLLAFGTFQLHAD